MKLDGVSTESSPTLTPPYPCCPLCPACTQLCQTLTGQRSGSAAAD